MLYFHLELHSSLIHKVAQAVNNYHKTPKNDTQLTGREENNVQFR